MLTNALRRSQSELFKANPYPRPIGQVLPLRPRGSVLAENAARPVREEPSEPSGFDFTVEVSPREAVKRRRLTLDGMAAEILQSSAAEEMEIGFRAPVHLLVFTEQGMRSEGETHVEGLPGSSLRDPRRKLTLVPAGRDYRHRQVLRGAMRIVCFYLDPESLAGGETTELTPRLFFEDAALIETAMKLAALIERSDAGSRPYGEALGAVLVHELLRLEDGGTASEPMLKGGLAAWQERTVRAYIEEHLDEKISLATLAGLVRLSPFYFCRAFKQTFGVPPHRYHTRRRIERAKELLAKPNPSVTQIGLAVGFSETSSFTAAFRKATGLTPSAYHRSLI